MNTSISIERDRGLRRVRRLHTVRLLRGVLSARGGQVGATLVCLVLALGFLGPLFAPFSPTTIVDTPFAKPSGAHLLGTDLLGRDALSRFLWGGRTLVLTSFAATMMGYLVGIPLGAFAGVRGGIFDIGTIALSDIMLAIPSLVFVLVLLAAVGPSVSMIAIGIAAVEVPRVIRIFRAITVEVGVLEFVEIAIARGETTASVVLREIIPNIWTPLMADFGFRLTTSIVLVSSLSYLGLGQAPPAADWGLMISENQFGLIIQPWIIVVPAVTIAVLTFGVNLLTDSVARRIGRSVTDRGA
jgi:peptide/nickel transport system permease protein